MCLITHDHREEQMAEAGIKREVPTPIGVAFSTRRIEFITALRNQIKAGDTKTLTPELADNVLVLCEEVIKQMDSDHAAIARVVQEVRSARGQAKGMLTAMLKTEEAIRAIANGTPQDDGETAEDEA